MHVNVSEAIKAQLINIKKDAVKLDDRAMEGRGKDRSGEERKREISR